jgi:hypothetical protein
VLGAVGPAKSLPAAKQAPQLMSLNPAAVFTAHTTKPQNGKSFPKLSFSQRARSMNGNMFCPRRRCGQLIVPKTTGKSFTLLESFFLDETLKRVTTHSVRTTDVLHYAGEGHAIEPDMLQHSSYI